MEAGILYGIGVGPGDPELMTLKGAATIRSCDVIAVPHKDRNKCLALNIALGAVPELAGMPVLEIDMPMTKDPAVLDRAYRTGADAICAQLAAGKRVGFLTLGDPSVYSTYMYLHALVLERGYGARMVPGVPSFCAAAAAANEPLCLGAEELHIIPGNYGHGDALSYPGVRVIMKHDLPGSRDRLAHGQVTIVENCGLPGQRISHDPKDLEKKSYFRLVILRPQESEPFVMDTAIT